VKTIPVDGGKARTPAIVAALVLLAPGAILAMLKPRPGCRMPSGPNSTRRDGAISKGGWSRKFEDPIVLPDRRKLVTLRDAATYITALSKKDAALPEWQAVIEALLLVAARPCSRASAS
jgi:hypothetical protein